jgi:hypothetical protein
MSVSDMLADILAKRNQMPLYYLLFRLWVSVGQNEFVLRYFSVIWAMLSLPLFFRLGQVIAGRQVGLLSAFFLAIAPFHIWYSQETRMYTLAVFSILSAHWFLTRLLKRDKRLKNQDGGASGDWIDWLGYGLSMLVGIYTHYFPLLILPAHYVFFVFHYRRHELSLFKWLTTACLVGLAAAIWVGLSLMSGAGKLAAPPWIQPVRWYEPILSLVTFSSGRTVDQTQPFALILLGTFLVGIAIALFSYWRIKATNLNSQTALNQTLFVRLLLIWLFVPMSIAFLVSLEWPVPGRPSFSIYVDRYLIIVLPAFLLLAAWGIVILAQRLHWRWLPPAVAMAAIVLVYPGLVKIYVDPSVGREDWRSALNRLDRDIQPDDTILLRPDVLLPLEYYTNNQSKIVEMPASTEDQNYAEAFSAEMEKIILKAAGESDRAWLITNFYISDTHGNAAERNKMVKRAAEHSPQRAWVEGNYPVLADWEYPGIRLTLVGLNKSPQFGK